MPRTNSGIGAVSGPALYLSHFFITTAEKRFADFAIAGCRYKNLELTFIADVSVAFCWFHSFIGHNDYLLRICQTTVLAGNWTDVTGDLIWL